MIRLYHQLILYILLTLFLSACRTTSNNSSSTKKDIEVSKNVAFIHKIDSILQIPYQAGKLNGNVLVVQNNKRLYSKSFGYANDSKDILLTADYRFGIGSIYKEFPAVAIMQLVEKGQLQLEDKLSKHLPKLPEWAEKIKIKHLLQYTSGLPRINFGKYFSIQKTITDEDIMQDLMNLEQLEFQPGTDYIYSNNCPFLLIKVVESITQQSFNNYAQNQLFVPFKLKSAVIKQQYPYQDKTLMALPFNTDYQIDEYKINAHSILFSATTEDLYQWLKHLHNYQIISEKSLSVLADIANLELEQMQAPLGNCIKKKIKSQHICTMVLVEIMNVL